MELKTQFSIVVHQYIALTGYNLFSFAVIVIFIFYHPSNRMMISFMQLVNDSDIALPTYILNRICSHCSALLINSKIRLRPRSRKSKINRKMKSNSSSIVKAENRITSELVLILIKFIFISIIDCSLPVLLSEVDDKRAH